MLLTLLMLALVFLYHSDNLLLSLLLLEIFSFMVLYFVSSGMAHIVSSDFLIIVLFSVFVMEGVIALSGLIMLVSSTGSDYVSSSSLTKC